MSTNPYSPPKASLEGGSQVDPAPALWNPNAAANWSLLFSPIFGAVLHMKNWQALGEEKKAAESKLWAVCCTGFFALITVLGAFLPETNTLDIGTRAAGLGLLIAWYVLNGRAQTRYVTDRYGTHYPRKGWGKPLLYATLCFVAFLAAVVVLVLMVVPIEEAAYQ